MVKKKNINSEKVDQQGMNKLSSTTLLKILVKEAIVQQKNESIIYKENDGFGNLSAHVQSNPLYATFIQPFADIVQTGAYAVKRIGAVTGNELSSVLKQTAAAAIPFIAADTMDEIKAESRAELTKALGTLDKEYADVINRNIDAIMNQTDVWGLAFLFNPGMLLGSKLLVKAPQVTASLLGTILGGKVKDLEQLSQARASLAQCKAQGGDCSEYEQEANFSIGDRLATYAHELHLLDTDPSSVFFSQRKHGGGGSHAVDWSASASGGYGGYGDYGFETDGYLEEIQNQPQFQPQPQVRSQQVTVDPKQIKQWAEQRKKQLIGQINQTLKDPKVRSSVANSNFGKQMQQAGTNSVLKSAKNNLNFHDWNQMLQRHGKNQKLKQLDNDLTNSMTKQNMNEEQIMQAKNNMIPVIKLQMKQMLIQQIQKNGLSGNTKFGTEAVSKTIQQINSIP